jgi:hypothetical protein
MLLNLLKTIDPWEVFLPLVIFFGFLFAAKYFKNNQMKVAFLLVAVTCLVRFLFVLMIVPFLWWQICCYLCMIIVALITCVVSFNK